MAQHSLLVVGGGIAGMSLAIRMRERGWKVDLVESDPQWRVYGAGISITGPTFRAFKRLGVLDELKANGYPSEFGVRICIPTGQVVADIPTPPIEPGMPVQGGIMRPVLHSILSNRTRGAGTDVRLGVTMTEWSEDNSGQVTVKTSDGQLRTYSLVVVADGALSKTRERLFPDAPKPKYTGQYCWRLVADRPAEIDRCHFYLAHPITAGLMPTSATQMYMFLLSPEPEKVRVAEGEQWQRLRQLMAPFGGVLGKLRDQLSTSSQINVRPLEAVLVPRPWHRGHVAMIGDAVHATTPHLASGAGIAVEDALVLSEYLASESDIGRALDAFEERRWERCRMVVENSVAIGDMELNHASPDKLKALMAQSEQALRADI
jgi:2-polyprenyl-6-methoxyphenol hydroxylase-like FAD-dependent oxidoreductase